MPAILQDLRYGIRMSLRTPALTLVAVFTLGMGVAANTTIFSYVDMMMLRPIPGAPEGDRVVAFEGVAADGRPLPTSYRDFRDYRDRLNPILELAIGTPSTVNIGTGDRSSQVWTEVVSANYFATLGIRPALGRLFRRDEDGDVAGAAPVAVLGYDLWKSRFNGDPHAIGTSLVVNMLPMTIVGVAPQGFHGSMPGIQLQFWVPITAASELGLMPAGALDDRGARGNMAIARLRPGVTIARARAECAATAHRMAEASPATNGGIGALVLPVRKSHFGGQNTLEGPLRILMTACGLVFLIVCANVANLLLARVTTRRREFSLRMVVGGGHWRLARQLFAESLVLAVMGVLIGLPMAMWMSRGFGYLQPRGANLPVSLDLPVNGDILWFNALICVLACVASGVAPALHGVRTNLNEALKDGGRSGTASRRSQRLSRALIVSEVAMATLAIIAAGLFARSFDMARRIYPGFDAANVLVAHLELSATGYESPQRKELCDRLSSRLLERPGVTAVSWAETVPLWFFGGPVNDVAPEGYVPSPSESMGVERNLVAPGYLNLVRIPILAGRDFDDHDTSSATPVLIVNQTFASRYFSGREAVGRHVRVLGENYTVVGVARDCKYQKPTESAQPFLYLPYREKSYGPAVVFHIRTTGEPEQAAGILRRELSAVNPSVRVLDVLPMAECIRAGLYGLSMAAVLLGVLGVFALALAVTGLYSVMAYAVAQRTQEIGIRMALGARAVDVLSMVVRQGMWLTITGVAAGMALAFAVMRFAASLLVHISPADPLVFVGAPLLLLAVAMAANYLPAHRATRVDPNVTLHEQ